MAHNRDVWPGKTNVVELVVAMAGFKGKEARLDWHVLVPVAHIVRDLETTLYAMNKEQQRKESISLRSAEESLGSVFGSDWRSTSSPH